MKRYTEYWRTNYFCVKDPAAFATWVDSFGLPISVQSADPADYPSDSMAPLTLIPDAQSELEIPVSRRDPHTGETLPCDFVQELATHLADESVAILIAIRYHRTRILYSYAITMRSNGDHHRIILTNLSLRPRGIPTGTITPT